MTIAEANAVAAVLRYLLDPDNVVTAERAAAEAAYLASRVRRALLAGPDPDQVREWVEKHAEQVRAQHDEVERLRAEVKRRDQDAARWQHVEPFLTRAREKGSLYLDVDDLLDAVQDAETGADDGTCGAVSEHGDVCVRQDEHIGLCQSVGRRHVSSPGQAGKPWCWHRDDLAAKSVPGPVAASTLRPDMVVTCPTWLNGDPVRIVTARVGAGVVAIRYRDVRAHHPDTQVKVPLDFAVTPGCGFVDGAR